MTPTDPLPPQSAPRRLLERFALIALGLYHLPLLLNNYPSLGGGGGSEGLAVRWGHVFTPVGMWVARHAFGMTGPMPAAINGDNGDVGEEWGRLLLAIVIGVVGSAIWTFADRKRPRARWTEPVLRVMLRYSIALGLASYAIAKILPQQFPPLTAMNMEDRLGDLSPMALLWDFMRYSQPYAFFGGVMELSVVVLLCFRRTATLGALMCMAVMTNVALMNWDYGVQVKLYATMMVVSAAVLVLYDAPRLLAVFVGNQPAEPAPMSSPVQDAIPFGPRWAIKVLVVGSVIVSSVIGFNSLRSSAPPSPLDGGWVVTAFSRDGQALETTGDPARWRRFITTGGAAEIRMESDSLIGCRRTTPTATTIALTCRGNRTGELTWTRTDNELRLEGTFAGTRVAASARHLEEADYRLLRTKTKLIFDR
jgi:hypothetical protein